VAVEVPASILEWADWHNHRRLLAPIGYVPPAEFESACYRSHASQAMAA
jgi:putative transposase